ncbi:unnamed protein product, partial [marine sediment metagenome]
ALAISSGRVLDQLTRVERTIYKKILVYLYKEDFLVLENHLSPNL